MKKRSFRVLFVCLLMLVVGCFAAACTEDEHVHEYTDVVTPPTCTEQGYTTHTCEADGENYIDSYVDALGHDWGEGEVTKEATCTAAGERTFTCSRCGETKTETVAAKGHTPGEAVRENEVAATCSEAGSYDEVVYCTVCNTEISRETVELPTIAHTPGEAVRENEVAATCSEAGSYDEVVYCTVCNTELSRETVRTSALGHDIVEHEGKAATCTEVGWNAYVTCSRCDYTTYEEIPATGHTPGPAATCTTAQTCTVCGAVITPAAGHTPGEAVRENEVAATCSETGSYEEVVYCTVCEEEISRETKEIAALGHVWDEGEVTKEAGCIFDGTIVYTCTRCKETRQEAIPAKGHDFIAYGGQAPTCTTAGWTAYEECSRCHYSTRQTLPALDHDWGEGEVTTEPTCTVAGVMTYTCSRCSTTKTEPIAALEHDWGEGEVTTEPTCTVAGVMTYTCSRCGETKTEPITAKGHTEVVDPAVAATCSHTGLTEGKHCSVCNTVLVEQTEIQAIPHTFGGNNICSVCGGVKSADEIPAGQTVDVHDPSIILAYADAIGNVYPDAGETGSGRQPIYFIFGTEIVAAYSYDMESWLKFSPTFYKVDTTELTGDYYEAFRPVADWSGFYDSESVRKNTWAPDIIYNTSMNKWCIYYSISGDANGHKQSSIFMMTSDNITGPYVYGGHVVLSGFTNSTTGLGNDDFKAVTTESSIPERYYSGSAWNNNYSVHCIDPSVLYDGEELWLNYGSWSGGIFLLKLDNATGLREMGYDYQWQTKYPAATLNADGTAWEGTSLVYDPYMGIHIAGGYYVSGEGPYIAYINGYYYLFLSYGGYAPDSGYNMRVFRSETIDGKYVDMDGTWAVYASRNGENFGSDISHGEVLMQNYKWSWWTGPASLSQGHNSVLVDGDKIYLVYHIKYDDGTIRHNVEVHELVMSEDGWPLAAPFQKSETDKVVSVDMNTLAGSWSVILHDTVNYKALEFNTDKVITLTSDGNVTGAYTGTWSLNGQYITITIGGVQYKGVVMEQQIEGLEGENVAYTFTATNATANTPLWGVKNPEGQSAAESVLESIVLPGEIIASINLPTEGDFGTTITYSSSKPEVLSDTGVYTAPAEDTEVTLRVTVTSGTYTSTKEFTIKALSETNILALLPDEIADDGYLLAYEPAQGEQLAAVPEVNSYTGVSVTLRVKDLADDWDVIFRAPGGDAIVYLSVLNYLNSNVFESAATLSEAGQAFTSEKGAGSYQIFFGQFCDDGTCYATISYNVDGSITFYRNGELMLTYGADMLIGTSTVRSLAAYMTAQIRTQGLVAEYSGMSNVIIGYAADYDAENVPESPAVIGTIGTDNGDGTYTNGFNVWEDDFSKEVSGDFTVTYNVNVKAPSNTTAAGGPTWNNWELKIGDWILRADYYSMDDVTDFPAREGIAYSVNPGWAEYCAAYLDADVTLTIKRTGASVTVTAVIKPLSGGEYTYTATDADFGTGDVTVWLGGENCLISIYSIEAVNGEAPQEDVLTEPLEVAASKDITVETGLEISFTIANSEGDKNDWLPLIDAGGYLITAGNLDPFATTGELSGYNCYPGMTAFGGANWDVLLVTDPTSIRIVVTTANGVEFYKKGELVIHYAPTDPLNPNDGKTVSDFVRLFLAEVEANGFTFWQEAFALSDVTYGPAMSVVAENLTLGAEDNTTGYTGAAPLWTGSIEKGQKVTATGTATCDPNTKSETDVRGVWNAPLPYLWTGATAGLNFRPDNWINGEPDNQETYPPFYFAITKTFQGFTDTSLNGVNEWTTNLVNRYNEGSYGCTIVWDYTASDVIVITVAFDFGDVTYNQRYEVRTTSDSLLDTYSIGLGVDYACFKVDTITVQ